MRVKNDGIRKTASLIIIQHVGVIIALILGKFWLFNYVSISKYNEHTDVLRLCKSISLYNVCVNIHISV